VVAIYGDSLALLYVNTMTQVGEDLYRAAVESFGIPPERQGVPALIVGDRVLVGSGEIPADFPGLIERGLEAGGIPWPEIPGLEQAVASLQPVPTEEAEGQEEPTPEGATQAPAETKTATQVAAGSEEQRAEEEPPAPVSTRELTVMERIQLDPIGNSISIGVLIGMILSLAGVLARAMVVTRPKQGGAWTWAVPVLCLIGLGVAGYLTYVESTGVLAVCGPVGDCNTVQGSVYAKLFGVVPVAALGFAGYGIILASWAVTRTASGLAADVAKVASLGVAALGTLFSVYLTFLEPFVIGATCAWCLTSAVVITAILWLTAPPGRAALQRLSRGV
jgi:uncharacterized membrane protein